MLASNSQIEVEPPVGNFDLMEVAAVGQWCKFLNQLKMFNLKKRGERSLNETSRAVKCFEE